MSNIYIYEPATNGKVVLETTMGDIGQSRRLSLPHAPTLLKLTLVSSIASARLTEIELWSKEAPKACRNFIA
jgi:peptidyl-prolyl cis-trans isomerase SDCCAG10